MSAFMRLRDRLRSLVHRRAMHRDLDLELAAWVDELAARHEAAGLSPIDARRRALAETGGLTQVKEQVHEVRFRAPFDRLRVDVVTACRGLLATPAPTIAAVVTLAAAVGINLAMFSLIGRALLNQPSHVTDPAGLFNVTFLADDTPAAGRMRTTSYVTFKAVRDQVPALSAAAAFQRSVTTVVIDGEQRQAKVMLVSGGYFPLLGVRPVLGTGLPFDGEDASTNAPVAILSHTFWRTMFGSDREAIGRPLTIGGLDYLIGGVMPDGFSGHSATDVDLWVPFGAAMRNSPGWDREPFRNFASIIVRLAPGATVVAADTQASAATGRRTRLASIGGADVAPAEQQVAWWLTCVSALVLVIGLANAGTLLVVRASRRRHDLAIRSALGASRGRLVVQASLEALILSAAATGLSLILASWFDEALRRILFPGIVAESRLPAVTVAAALGASLLVALVAAAATLWPLRKPIPHAILALGRRGSGRTGAMGGLLLVQTALAVVLLAGAAMFGRSFYKLAAQDFGMEMDGVVVVDLEPGPHVVPDRESLFGNALATIRTLPGVEMGTVVDSLPFGGFNVPPISVPGRLEPPSVGGQLPFLNAATPEFMAILGIRIVAGRTFTENDDRGPLVVIVNQTMAREVWPGETAIGKCIRIGFDPDFDPSTATGPPTPTAAVPCREVIGVVRDIRQRSVVPSGNEDRLMQYFVPFSQIPRPPFAHGDTSVRGLLLRTSLDVDQLAAPIRRLVVGDRRNLPFVRVVAYRQLLDRQMRPWQMGTTLLVLFSALALGVAAIGLYAAFTHAVAERRHEMAIRLAIGANPAEVLTMVLREAMVIAAIGAVLGCTAAVLAGRWVQSLLFETTPSDPLVLASAAAGMLLVAVAATFLPAHAASKADPNSLLRVQ